MDKSTATNPQSSTPVSYTDDNIRHLSDMEHVRTVRVCILVVWAMESCLKMVYMYS